MESNLQIPLTFSKRKRTGVFERVSVETSIRQLINLLVFTKPGECFFDNDFGYEIWYYEFKPIIEKHEWQPKLREVVKNMLEKHEPRITDIYVREPDIKNLIDIKNKENSENRHHSNKLKNKSEFLKRYKITLILEYTIRQTDEYCDNFAVSFEY